MNDENSIVKSGELKLEKFDLTPEFRKWSTEALEASALIGRVSNEVEDSVATKAAQELKAITNALEKARVTITAPALKFQRDAKVFFDAEAEEAKAEFMRLLKLTADYKQLLMAKQRAEENAKKEELTRIEREREQAMAQTKSHEQREAVQEHYNAVAAVEQALPPAAPVIPKGQSLAGDLEITVLDIWALAKAQPSCVRPPEIRLTETKALIRAGVNLPGIKWEEKLKVGIRAAGSRTVNV